MSCKDCNDNCRQGRDCPNRPEREFPWQDLTFFVLVALAVGLIYYAYLNVPSQSGYKIYDCSLAEISPDFPLEAKEACRKLRAKN